MISATMDIRSSGNLDRFQWQKAAVKWADTVGPIGRTALRARAPRGKGPRAGRFATSIRYQRKTVGGASVQAVYTANTPYARYVIEPTRAHTITAKAARTLRWTDSGGGSRFARSVRHPGTPGNPFHISTMKHYVPVAQAAYTRIMREALGGL